MGFDFLKRLFSSRPIKFKLIPARTKVVITNAEVYIKEKVKDPVFRSQEIANMDNCFGFNFFPKRQACYCYNIVFDDPEVIKWLKSKIGKTIQVKVFFLKGQISDIIPTCFERRARCKCGRFVKPGSKCGKCYKRKRKQKGRK